MIKVDGSDISEVMKLYPDGSAEFTVLKNINDSPVTYNYGSIDELKFEVQLRKEIAKSAMTLNDTGFHFSTFHKSRCNPAYWERTENGGFKLRSGVSPAAAINDIFVNGEEYANECATAMQIVYYGALLKVLGADAFDALFPDIYLMNWNAVNPNLHYIGYLKDTGDKLIGDRAYFSNPDVDPATPEWQGENTIVLPRGMFYGHGIGIRSADSMIASLNRHRDYGSGTSAYLRDGVGRLDFKKLYKIYNHSVSAAAWAGYSAAVFA